LRPSSEAGIGGRGRVLPASARENALHLESRAKLVGGMKYRLVFRRRGRPSTSKRLKRISTTSARAAQPGRPVVLRAKPQGEAPAVDSTAVVSPTREQPALMERFRVEGIVADDGTKRVASVVELRTGRRSTLATCALGGANDWDAWERFGHECRVLRSLAHAGVPRYLEHGQTDTVAYLLTDRIEGRSLAARMQRDERWSDTKLRHILVRMLDVLAYLHELNPPVFHCDVHPGAIVVSDRGDVLLTGFGRARSRLAGDDDRAEPIGRAGYVPDAPWQFVASAATDAYALGATMVAIASGRDAALLPRAGKTIDVEACMKPSPVRDAVRALLADDAAACIAAAARLRKSR
jgi:serine/threonine protein kinase